MRVGVCPLPSDDSAARVRCGQVAKLFFTQDVRRAFNQWVETWQEAQDTLRALAFFFRTGQAHAFATWAENVLALRVERQQHTVALRFLARLQNVAAAAAFERWLEACEQAATDRQRLRRAVLLFTKRAMACAFVQVRGGGRGRRLPGGALEIKGAESPDAGREASCALLPWSGEQVAQPSPPECDTLPAQWVEAVDEAHELRGKMAKALRIFTHRHVLMAWEGWLDGAEWARHARRICAKVAAAMMQRELRGAFMEWADLLADAQEAQVRSQPEHLSPV